MGEQRPIRPSYGPWCTSDDGFNCRLHLLLAWGNQRFDDGFTSSPN